MLLSLALYILDEMNIYSPCIPTYNYALRFFISLSALMKIYVFYRFFLTLPFFFDCASASLKLLGRSESIGNFFRYAERPSYLEYPQYYRF